MEWVRFLEENNIHYVTRGPNTRRSEVSIKCPMCGDEDGSEHLGIDPKTEKWGCLRDQSHRGKSSRTLVKAILGCSNQQAGLIVRQYSHADPDSLEAALTALDANNNGVIKHEEDLAKQAKHQRLGPQFNDFSQIKVRGITRRFFDYLMDRGYENPQDIIKYYNLRCALVGRYKDRIIIPVTLNGELLGWTSRAIVQPKIAPRYLASSEEVKTTVYNFDELKKGGQRLFIVEGPFDAIKMDNYGRRVRTYPKDGVEPEIEFRATCTFGTSVTVSQLALLRVLVKKYDETWVLFDVGADGPARNVADWTGAKLAQLPIGIDDPGELKDAELQQLTRVNFNGWFNYDRLSELVASTLQSRTSELAKSLMAGNAGGPLQRLSNKSIGGINRKSTPYWQNSLRKHKP